jgi:hypothetical protein
VKRSGRDESILAVIHLCMEAMLGICLYSCSYLKLAKMPVFHIIAYVFSSTKLEKRAEQVLSGSEGGGRKRERGGGQGSKMAQTMSAHMNRIKNQN